MAAGGSNRAGECSMYRASAHVKEIATHRRTTYVWVCMSFFWRVHRRSALNDMTFLNKDQRAAALVVPVVLFGLLGASDNLADFSNLDDEQIEAIERAYDLRESGDFDGARGVLERAGILRAPEEGSGAQD
jgi:hypothetical protein